MGVGKAVLASDAQTDTVIAAEPHLGRLRRSRHAAAVGALFSKWVASPAPGVFSNEFSNDAP